jgi:hypothetical protein
VAVLAVVPNEELLDTLLFGWRDARNADDGLDWLRSRLELVSAA